MIDQHASLAEKFLKKGFWLYLFWYIIAPIGYIVKILVSWEISVSELWILYGVISLITLLWAFSDLGAWESLKYFIPKYVEKKRYSEIKSILIYAAIFQIFSSLILLSVFFFWAEFLSENYFKSSVAKPVIQVFSLFFLGINIFNLLSQFFLSVQNTFYYKLSEFIRNSFIFISILIIIFTHTSSLQNLALSWIIGLYIWVVFASILFLKKYYSQYFSGVDIIWSWELFRNFFSYSFFVFLSAQAWMFLSQIDMQMIIYLLSSQDAWYYSVYLSLIMIPFLIIGPIFALLLPIFSELAANAKLDAISKLKWLLQKWFSLVWIFFGTFLFTFAPQISFTLFWENFFISWEVLRYSCLFLLFNFLLQINFNIMWWLWKIRLRLMITLIAICINIFLNIILIKNFGVSGAALATWIGWMCMWGMSEYALGFKYFHYSHLWDVFKNIIFLSVFSYISINYISIHISSISRFQNLFFLLWIWIVWLLFFIVSNKVQTKIFIWEITRIRWKKKS